jgi:formylglycine-generating enzyme required for sulfatase activity
VPGENQKFGATITAQFEVILKEGIHPTAEIGMKDFFISYNKADRQWAEWIAWQLEEAGYSLIIQEWDFRPGGNFVIEMQKALEGTKKTISVLSESYLNAEFTQPEWAAVFARDPQSLQGTLLLVKVENCEPQGLLTPLIYVSLLDMDEPTARDKLLSALKDRGKPDQPPFFPGAPAKLLMMERAIKTKPLFPEIYPTSSFPLPQKFYKRRKFIISLVLLSAGIISTLLLKFLKFIGIAGIELKQQSFVSVRLNHFGITTKKLAGSAMIYEEILGKGTSIAMVKIPAGKFTMGSPTNEKDRDKNESPQHDVSLPEFYLGQTLITQKQWKAIMGIKDNPSRFKGDELPVDSVTWLKATEFCTKLSKKTGRTYRLPSEKEWEYACRAGTTSPFAFGETITPALANYDGNYPYANEPKGEYRKKTTPVRQFPPNSFGLYDMHGNLCEWCLDEWIDNYKKKSPNSTARKTTKSSASREYVLRGGSWDYGARTCRSADRSHLSGSDNNDHNGFRVVVSNLNRLTS